MERELRRICRYAEDCLRIAARDRVAPSRQPAPGSPAANELEESTGRQWEHLMSALSLSWLRLMSAEDHLGALARLLRDPEPVFSLYTLARGTIETSVRAWWLLDPACGARDRAERGLSEQLYSYEEQRRVPIEHTQKHAMRRSEQVSRLADAEGLEVTGDNERPPRTMPLMRSLVDNPGLADAMSRLLAAHAHGTGYALQDRVLSGTARPTTVEGVAEAAIGRDLRDSATTLLMAFSPYMKAVTRQFAYYGWPRQQLVGALVYATAEIRAHLAAEQ